MQSVCLFIGIVWPEPTSSAAGKRILQLIELFQNQGYKIVFASASQKSEYSFNLKSIGVDEVSILLNDDSFNSFVKEINPEIVVYDRFYTEEQFGWRVTAECPNTIQILDTEDLHCLRQTRHEKLKKNEEFKIDDLLESEIAIREIASIYRCDISLIISEFEMEILKKIFSIPEYLIYYLPLFFEKDALVNSYEERTDFVFIGNFMHEPNWDAVRVIKKDIWPELRKKCPDAKMMIYGAYPTQKVFDLHNEKERFFIKGRAESSIDVLSNARVLLAPIRFGAGQKGKILEAISVGTPFVTTSLGVEGISKNLSVKIENFAEESVKMYKDKAKWYNIQCVGFEVLKKYSQSNFKIQFETKISDLKQNQLKFKSQNFIRKILNQNSHNSLKYMSLWITEKNK